MMGARSDDGLTLVEVAVAMVIAVVVMIAAYDELSSASQRITELERRTTTQNEVRLALDALAKDARQSSTGRADLARVHTAAPTELGFYSPDASRPAVHLRRIEYRVADDTLQRRTTVSVNTVDDPWAGRETWTWGDPGQWVGVVSDVTAATAFSYRDGTGAATTDPHAVQTIDIHLVVDPNGDRPPGVQTFEMTIDIRGPS